MSAVDRERLFNSYANGLFSESCNSVLPYLVQRHWHLPTIPLLTISSYLQSNHRSIRTLVDRLYGNIVSASPAVADVLPTVATPAAAAAASVPPTSVSATPATVPLDLSRHPLPPSS